MGRGPEHTFVVQVSRSQEMKGSRQVLDAKPDSLWDQCLAQLIKEPLLKPLQASKLHLWIFILLGLNKAGPSLTAGYGRHPFHKMD